MKITFPTLTIAAVLCVIFVPILHPKDATITVPVKKLDPTTHDIKWLIQSTAQPKNAPIISSRTINKDTYIGRGLTILKDKPTYLVVYQSPTASGAPEVSIITPDNIQSAGNKPVITIDKNGNATIIPLAPPLQPTQPSKPYQSTKAIPSTKDLIGKLTLGMLMPQHLLGENPSIVHPSRTLLIFLDDSETDPGFVTESVLAALYQEAGPILVSGSLLQNIFGSKMDDQTYQHNMAIAKKILLQNSLLPSPSPYIVTTINEAMSGIKTVSRKNFNAFVLAMIIRSFKPEHWLVAEVNPYLFLLVPIKKIQGNNERSYNGFSERELNLGLKIDHMIKIESGSLSKKFAEYTEPKDRNYFIQAVTDGSIFITRSEYAKLDAFILPQWSLYMSGHGSLGKLIAFIPIDQFPKYLEFLNTKILTKLLIYSSCFAAGINAEEVYEDLQRIGQQKTFPFPIVLEGASDVTVRNRSSQPKLDNNNVVLQFHQNFSDFLDQTNEPEPVPLSAVLQPVFKSLRDILNSEVNYLENYPLIRPANREQFISLLPGVEITKTMAATRTTPLDVMAGAKRKGVEWNTTYIFFNVNYVPFTLILKGQTATPILFSNPQDKAVHIIDRIESEYSLFKIVEKMFTAGPQALFLIRTFIDTSKQNHLTFTNVIIDSRDRNNKIAYASYKVSTGEQYIKIDESGIKKTDDDYINMKSYKSLLKKTS